MKKSVLKKNLERCVQLHCGEWHGDYGRKEIEIFYTGGGGEGGVMWNYTFVSWSTWSAFFIHVLHLQKTIHFWCIKISSDLSAFFRFFISVEDLQYSIFSFAVSCFSCLLCISKMVSLKSSQNDHNSLTFILLFVFKEVFSHVCISPFWRL